MKGIGTFKKIMIAGVFVAASTAMLTACSSGETDTATEQKAKISDTLSAYPKADMNSYEGLEGYDKDIVFVEMDVKDIKKEIDDKNTFVFVASFAKCPYCNKLVPYLNDVALEEGVKVGYIDTRKNPEWKSNMDIDDYDLFVEMFDEYIKTDENEKKHLYVPQTFFIKNGEVVFSHDGVCKSLEDASSEMTDEMKEEVRNIIRKGFDKMR